MPAPRKPKKALIQFAVALVVALLVGLGAIVLTLTVVSGATTQAQKAQEEAKEAEAKANLERERLAKERKKEDIKIAYKQVQVTTDIVPGQPITKEMLSEISTDVRPEAGTVTMMRQAVGKMVRTPISAGEVLTQNQLLDSGGWISVKDGMRAITIQVDNVGGLGGALAPGIHVDVLTTVSGGGDAEKKTVTRTILQNIQVLSIPGMGTTEQSQKAAAPVTTGGTVTLAVSPKQAELLTLANQTGKFHLTLRSFTDKKVAKVSGVDVSELMTGINTGSLKKNLPGPPEPPQNGFHNVNFSPNGNLPDPLAAGVEKPKHSMEIYKGSASETVEFER